MGDPQLDFKINLQSSSAQGPMPQFEPQPQGGLGGVNAILARAGHPTAVLFHLGIKAAALFTYLFLNIFLESIIVFILVLLLAAADFWSTQNVTGRLLVGLRWRSLIKEDGTEEWIFESLDEKMELNTVDVYAFWLGVALSPLLWGLFFVLNVLSFKLLWTMLDLICAVLGFTNFIGYWKCNKDHKAKLSGLVKTGVMSAAFKV
jgi:hypothetical protein